MITMSRRRSWLFAGLVASSALALGACKKEEKKNPSQPAGETRSGEQNGGVGKTPTPSAPSSASVGDDLSLLPVDSEVVMGLNFAQLQQSALWKKFVEPQLVSGDAMKQLAEFKTSCGFDPLEAIKSVSVGMKNATAEKPDGVIVLHGPDKSKVLGCFDKMKDKAAAEGTIVTRDGDVVTMKKDDDGLVVFTFVNDNTAVAVVGATASVDTLKAATAGNSALKTSGAFVDMYSKIKTGDSLWLLMNGNSKVFEQAARMGIKPKAVFGSVNVTSGLSLDLRMRLDSADQATQMATGFKGQAAALTSMVDKLDIAADGPDVKFYVSLSEQKLATLVQQFGGMLGAGLGAH
ncbi:MAG: hypothetical protein ACTHU0_07040 [Kofleriaceae bacterium]